MERGVSSHETALQRISTAQTERVDPLFEQQKSQHGEVRGKERERKRTKRDHWGTIDRHTYVPRFNQSLLKTLSPASSDAPCTHLLLHRFFTLRHFRTRRRSDNVIERNTDRIGWRK